MITEWFIDRALAAVEGFTELLPDVTLDLGGASDALALAMTFNAVVPVQEGLTVGLTLLAVTGAMFAYRVIKTLLAHVPFIGGSG